jgi:hypothetical protein
LTAGTLHQHAVAAEAIARGDLLFALYSGDPPPAAGEQLWIVPDGDEPGAIAATWQREAAVIAQGVQGVRCRCSVLGSHPLDAGALDRIAGMHVWSQRYLQGRLAGGEHLHALVVRAWAAPAAAAAGDAPAPPDEADLLPALTDSAFALLVARLEQALAGSPHALARPV